MNRRSFIRTAGTAATVAAVSEPLSISAIAANSHDTSHTRKLVNPQIDGHREEIASTLAPWSPATGEWNVHTAGHLYRRAGFSATMAELNAALAKTPGAVVDALLDNALTQGANIPAPPKHSDVWMNVPPYTYGSNTQQEQIDYAYAGNAIRRTWAATMAQPNTMLREKMTYFWSNHFVVEAQKVYYPHMLYNYLDYFRKNPWGNFKQMVKDVSILPAMLVYLDGAYSYRTAPNENYARELMELFTLGAVDKDGNPNYSESDIHEVAKALTGYTIDVQSASPVLPTKYNVNNHDSSFKQPFADAGAPKKAYGLSTSLHQVPDDIIDALFQYKGDKLAYFICGKLYQFFVYHDVTGSVEQGIISALATTFKNSNWELKPVISQLLKSEHFFDEANIGAEIKSPYEFMLGLCRSLDIPVDDLNTGTMYVYGAAVDQSLLDPPNVKGWPGDRAWVSTTTLPIRNFLFSTPLVHSGSIAANGSTGYGETHTAIMWSNAQVLTWASQFADYKGNINAFIDQVATSLCAYTPPANLQKSYIHDPLQLPDYEWPGLTDANRVTAIRQIVTAIVSLPEFQLM